MPTARLLRKPHRPSEGVPLLETLRLQPLRAHEFCGPARRSLALMLARGMADQTAPILWITCHWEGDRLHAPGVVPFVDPGRLLLVTPRRLDDVLWCMEEALRAGATPLVVAELPEPPALTPVRRLHLAAEAGGKRGQFAPLGLLLTPGDGGAAGVETRWHLSPRHQGTGHRWMLQRRRARMAPPAAWGVVWGKSGPELQAEL